MVLPSFHSRSRTGHLHLSGGYLGDAGRAAGNTHGGDAFLHGGGGALGKVFLDHPIWCAAPRAGHAWVHVSPPHHQRTHHQKTGPVLQVCSLILRICVPYHVTVSFPGSSSPVCVSYHTVWGSLDPLGDIQLYWPRPLRLFGSIFHKQENVLLGAVAACCCLLLVSECVRGSVCVCVCNNACAHASVCPPGGGDGWCFTATRMLPGWNCNQFPGTRCGPGEIPVMYFRVTCSVRLPVPDAVRKNGYQTKL